MKLSRRSLLAGIGAGTALAAAGVSFGTAQSASAAGTRLVRRLTGPEETGRWGAAWTDLCIPVYTAAGDMLFIGGDTFDGAGVGDKGWRSPVGFRSSNPYLNGLNIDSVVGGDYAVGLVDEPHTHGTTALPSDVFRVGDTLYMHLMRGRLHDTHHTDFWRSDDNGYTWKYLCQWPGNMLGGDFQQKTYAVADDGYAYVLSSRFNRTIASNLLLHRVRVDALGDPNAYEPWGWNGTDWSWGAPATSVGPRQCWGEISWRAMSGGYGFSWFDAEPGSGYTMKAARLALPTSNIFDAVGSARSLVSHDHQRADLTQPNPYGGFIVPGSTFDDFHVIVSQWSGEQQYWAYQYASSI